ncbi:MAG: hypothetical protein OER92_03855, partial [Alphaproteobacteria bacterium]|nr:hypothetical protein [Alphaproteobacteria bacterium]
ALARGHRPMVLIIPTGLDLTFNREHGNWVYEPLLEKLRDSGIDARNAGEGILELVGERDPCELFDSCNAHFNEEGYAVIALVVQKFLQDGRVRKN